MTYSWQILKLDTRAQTNADGVALADAVIVIQWLRIGVDEDGNSARIVGYTKLSAENTTEGDFTAFADLTEEQVVGWLNTINSAEQIASYDEKIAEKRHRGITTARDIPWS
jgi:hypothetical protein